MDCLANLGRDRCSAPLGERDVHPPGGAGQRKNDLAIGELEVEVADLLEMHLEVGWEGLGVVLCGDPVRPDLQVPGDAGFPVPRPRIESQTP